MKLTAIRHTRVAVPAGVCYGQTDVSLAESYKEELEQVKSVVANYSFDAVFCSPLKRCRLLAQDLFVPENIQLDQRLMELNFGAWEMQDWETISRTAEAQKWFDDFVEVRCAGGESFRDQINRTALFLDELNKQQHQQVVVVTHGGILRALNCLLEGVAPHEAFQTKIDYGQVIDFTFDSSKLFQVSSLKLFE